MKHTGIAEAGAALEELLRQQLVPSVVKSADQIGRCSPGEKSDLAVSIWLYDIRECEELRNHSMVTIDAARQRYPASCVMLYYMITAYSGGDIRYRAAEEQLILGKIIQVLKDHPVLGDAKERYTAEPLNLSMEEKMRIFNAPGAGYQTSLFYELGPIEIESEQTKDTKRVVSLTFGLQEN